MRSTSSGASCPDGDRASTTHARPPRRTSYPKQVNPVNPRGLYDCAPTEDWPEWTDGLRIDPDPKGWLSVTLLFPGGGDG